MTDTSIEVLKIAPPASVGGLSLFSLPLNEYVVIGTLVYTVLIILDKLFPGIVAGTAKWCLNYVKELFK